MEIGKVIVFAKKKRNIGEREGHTNMLGVEYIKGEIE